MSYRLEMAIDEIEELKKQKEFIEEMNGLLIDGFIYVIKGFEESIVYYRNDDKTLDKIFKLLEKIKQKPIEEILEGE